MFIRFAPGFLLAPSLTFHFSSLPSRNFLTFSVVSHSHIPRHSSLRVLSLRATFRLFPLVASSSSLSLSLPWPFTSRPLHSLAALVVISSLFFLPRVLLLLLLLISSSFSAFHFSLSSPLSFVTSPVYSFLLSTAGTFPSGSLHIFSLSRCSSRARARASSASPRCCAVRAFTRTSSFHRAGGRAILRIRNAEIEPPR